MSTPNFPNAVSLHAAGRVTGATGALQAGAANISGVVRNGAGDYTVTLGTEIDPTNRNIEVTVIGPNGAIVGIQTETDAGFQVLLFTELGAAVDADFYVKVDRTAIG